MVKSPGVVDSEQLDYALRRRSPALGLKTWNAKQAIDALAYGCCQHMQGRKREQSQSALVEETSLALQALVWPGQDLWCLHTLHIEVRRWAEDEALPTLTTQGSFASRAAKLAALLHARLVQAKRSEDLDDPATNKHEDEDDRWS